MAIYSVAEAKNKLPSLLAAVERGEAVTIARRGKPIADLKPVVAPPAPAAAADDPPYGSTAWLVAEMQRLPWPPGDLQATLQAMRNGDPDW